MIVFKNCEPCIGIGAPDSSRIVTAVTQVLVNVIDFDMDMATAVSVPRFHSEERQLLYLEPALPEEYATLLTLLGNEVERSTYMSRVQSIRITDLDELEAGADLRGGGGIGIFTSPG